MTAVVPQVGEVAPNPLRVRAHALSYRSKPRRVFRLGEFETVEDLEFYSDNYSSAACCEDCERADRDGMTLCYGCRYNRKRWNQRWCGECHADAMRILAGSGRSLAESGKSFGEWMYR